MEYEKPLIKKMNIKMGFTGDTRSTLTDFAPSPSA